MALVAIEFEDNQAFIAAARVAARRMEINRLFSVDLTGDDASAAENLKYALSQNGCSRADAIVVISRANAEMREVIVPPAPTNELPDMVRFIARNEFASMNDNWAFDFVPLSDDPENSRKVIAAGVSPELKSQVTSIAESAGLRIKHMVLRPYAAIDLIRSKVSDQKFRLLIDPNNEKTDLTLIHGTKLIATRTVPVSPSSDNAESTKALLAEAKRTIASSRKVLDGEKIASVILFSDGNTQSSVKDDLAEQLGCDVEVLNPISLAPISGGVKRPENSEPYASLMGALIQQNSTQRHMIDFVNPRRPIVAKRDLSKVYLYGGLAVATLLFAMVFGWWVLNSQQNENAKLSESLTSLIDQNAGNENRPSVDATIGEVGAIDDWVTNKVDWLEEIYQVSSRSLTADDTIVDSFDAEINIRRPEEAPRISVKSKLASVQDEKELLKSLGQRPFEVSTNRGSRIDDEDYSLVTSLTIKLQQDKEARLKELDERATAFITARNENMAAMDQEATETTDDTEESTSDSESEEDGDKDGDQ